MAELTDDRLAVILASVGEHLVVPDRPDHARNLATSRPDTPAAQRRWQTVAAAAAIVIALAVGALFVPPVREAAARWLGIGSTEIQRVGDEPGLAPLADLPRLEADATPLTAAEAEAQLGRPLPDTSQTTLGPPEHYARPIEGGVLLSWRQGETTLWVHEATAPVEMYLKKLVGSDSLVTSVDEVGDGALLVSGDHFLETPSRQLAARTVLLWTVGDIEYRLESDLPSSAMVEIGRAVR